MKNIAGAGRGVLDFRAQTGEGEDEFGQVEDGHGLTGGDIEVAGHVRGEGSMLESGGDVLDIDEVTGLVAVAKDGERIPGAGGFQKSGDGGGVRPPGILAWTVDVEKAEGDAGKGGLGAEFFPRELGFRIGAGRRGRGGFRFGHGGFIAVHGAGTGEDKAFGSGLGGGRKDPAGSFHIDFMAAGGVGDGFGDTDQGGEMEDVGDSGAGLGQWGGIENGALKEGAVDADKILHLAGGEVIEDGDGSPGGKSANKVAADKTGASGDKKLHSPIFPKGGYLKSAGKNGLRKNNGSGINGICE